MEKERNYDNVGLDPSEKYLRKKKKVMMMIPISLQKNENLQIIKSVRKFIERFFKIKKKVKI